MAASTARVHQHRHKVRNDGFRLVQLRVKDTRSESFKEECKRQSLALNHEQEKEVLDWMEQVQDYSGWTA